MSDPVAVLKDIIRCQPWAVVELVVDHKLQEMNDVSNGTDAAIAAYLKSTGLMVVKKVSPSRRACLEEALYEQVMKDCKCTIASGPKAMVQYLRTRYTSIAELNGALMSIVRLGKPSKSLLLSHG